MNTLISTQNHATPKAGACADPSRSGWVLDWLDPLGHLYWEPQGGFGNGSQQVGMVQAMPVLGPSPSGRAMLVTQLGGFPSYPRIRSIGSG